MRLSSFVATFWIAAALASCAAHVPGTPPATTPATMAAAPPPPKTPTFIEDDYPRALAAAKASGKPLFIDAWAPWCHTCLSMRSYVFTDAALRPLADQFVWLAIDTEKPDSAAFLGRYPMQFWPTLWVVDPKTEEPALKWLGSATAKELSSLLTDAAAGVKSGTPEGEAAAALMRGERASAEGKRPDAIREYRAALANAPPKWGQRARADEALVTELWAIKDDAACAELAENEMAKIPPGTSLANVGLFGLQCARRSVAGSVARGMAPRLARAVEQLALDPSVPILDDDRSGLFEEAVDDRNQDHDPAGAKSLATSWAAFLEARAKTATTPAARAVFDAHRLLAYIALGDPGRAVPMLTDSERDFPADYNPPARLAKALLELHRYEDALVAVDRAIGKGYGPRKLRLFLLKTDILAAKGDPSGVTRVADAAVTYADTLPPAERPASLRAELEKRRAPPKLLPAAN